MQGTQQIQWPCQAWLCWQRWNPAPCSHWLQAARAGWGPVAWPSHQGCPKRWVPMSCWAVPGEWAHGCPLPCPATCGAAGGHSVQQASPTPRATHPSPARPKHGGKEGKKLQVCFLKALGKNAVLEGTAKTNRPWQPDTAPSQAAQTAPAGCGIRRDRQGRGLHGGAHTEHSQPTPAREEGQPEGPILKGSHSPRDISRAAMDQPWRREWSWDPALKRTGIDTPHAPSAPR